MIARDLMTKKVVTVDPEISLIEAVNILLKHGFNGLPVTVGGFLVGIITEYDMILKGSSIHLPTFMKLFSELDVYKKDSSLIKDDLKKIFKIKVKDVMNLEPLALKDDSSIFAVVDVFTKHPRVNPIPIVDIQNRVVGIISRSDMLRFLGDANLDLRRETEQGSNKNVERFLHNFDKKFILVSRFRTRFWLIISILFVILGFIIAWALIIRIL